MMQNICCMHREFKWAFLLALIIKVQAVYALDPMYDYRYTLGPEILVPGAFHVGAGGWSHLNEDLTFATNIQLGLTNQFEIGAKFTPGTDQRWIIRKKTPYNPDDKTTRWYRKHNYYLVDAGVKYAISPHLSLQADVPIALNEDRDWGGVLSISQWDGYTKNVSFLFEGRLGFGGAAGEKDSYVKPMAALPFVYFQIGESIRFSVGPIVSFSFGRFKDDAMLDVLPRLELGLAWFRLTGEVSIGILTWEAEKHNRFALFIVGDV
jgi:hypothetical protein